MYEDTRVGSYGYPKRLTEGDYEGYFEVEERQDNAQMALDLWRKKHKNGPAPGMVPTVVFTGTEDEPPGGDAPSYSGATARKGKRQ
nr:MAG TPA: hypothetical protein [Caudoviricetes sp.]